MRRIRTSQNDADKGRQKEGVRKKNQKLSRMPSKNHRPQRKQTWKRENMTESCIAVCWSISKPATRWGSGLKCWNKNLPKQYSAARARHAILWSWWLLLRQTMPMPTKWWFRPDTILSSWSGVKNWANASSNPRLMLRRCLDSFNGRNICNWMSTSGEKW